MSGIVVNCPMDMRLNVFFSIHFFNCDQHIIHIEAVRPVRVKTHVAKATNVIV
jgi:hypothetical protein